MAKAKKSAAKSIEDKFEETAFSLAQERSDFLLPQILDFVSTRQWINLRPEYQRRSVWDVAKRSLFIESLLLNVPIPTLFFFEHELGRYEVMDGQQRLTAVVDFLTNKYELKGLKRWPELNGKKHCDLPLVLQRGLERRRLSATVVLIDRSSSKMSDQSTRDKRNDIRRLVFERLNTGGQNLNAQELRNCIYSGSFNDLLVELANGKRFRKIWEIVSERPAASKDAEDGRFQGDVILESPVPDTMYSRMIDVEIVLRYFAFSDPTLMHGSVRSILDNCMKKNRDMPPEEARTAKRRFEDLLELAEGVFGSEVFRFEIVPGKRRLSRPLFDSVMIALNVHWEQRKEILRKRSIIRKRIAGLMKRKSSYAVIVGRPNTTEAIRKRIKLVSKAIAP